MRGRGRRSRGSGDFAVGVVPFIDVLLILLVLLVLMAAGEVGRLSAVPVAVPRADVGAAAHAPESGAFVLIVSPEGVQRWEPGLRVPELVALPPPEEARADTLVVFCAQAGVRPGRPVQVAATGDSTHAQMVEALALLQRCGVREVSFLLQPPNLESR